MCLFACKYFQTPSRTSHTTPKSRQLFHSPYIPRQLPCDKSKKITSSIALSSPCLDLNKIQPQRTNHTVTTPIHKIFSDPPLAKEEDPSDDEIDSFELLSETLNRLQNTSNCSNKKSVGFNVVEEPNGSGKGKCDMKNNSLNKNESRHKSEPDLSRIFIEHTGNTTPVWNNGRLITSKLLKGVSMVNLKRPLFTDRKIIRTSASVLLNRKSTVNESCGTPLKENSLIDDEDFEATPNKESSLNWSQVSNEKFLSRRSMSPITKSTQRMSKAMQVSVPYLTVNNKNDDCLHL